MYQSSCVFTCSIGYVGGPGSGTEMLVVRLLVLAEWRAPNVMALKLQHDRFQSAGAGSMRPRLYSGRLEGNNNNHDIIIILFFIIVLLK